MTDTPEDRPPLAKFFQGAEALATCAFQMIPVCGDVIAEYFNRVVVPAVAGPRDRCLVFLLRPFRRKRVATGEERRSSG